MLSNQNQQTSLSHGTLPVPWLTLILTVLTVGLYYWGGALFDLCIFDKAAVCRGEIWRVFTGHFFHCSFEHLFWDLAAFVILAGVIETHSRKQMVQSLFISCLGVSLWLVFGYTQFPTYCGLSGALNGLLVVAALNQWLATENKVYLLVILATIGKIIFELTTHQTIFTSLASQSVPGSHTAGLITGIMYIVISQRKRIPFLRTIM